MNKQSINLSREQHEANICMQILCKNTCGKCSNNNYCLSIDAICSCRKNEKERNRRMSRERVIWKNGFDSVVCARARARAVHWNSDADAWWLLSIVWMWFMWIYTAKYAIHGMVRAHWMHSHTVYHKILWLCCCTLCIDKAFSVTWQHHGCDSMKMSDLMWMRAARCQSDWHIDWFPVISHETGTSDEYVRRTPFTYT